MNKDKLAILMRPTTLSEYVGQEHLLAPGKILYNLINTRKISSMIFYGQPGIGKTTLAYIIANEINADIISLNAAIDNKAAFDKAIAEAIDSNQIILIDEIHRMNKDKQDILLPYLESGDITIIGMTSENPYHKINPAIRSRLYIFKLEPLCKEDVKKDVNRLLNKDILPNLNIDDDVIDYLAESANGDLRFVYNNIELAYYSTTDGHITNEVLKNVNFTPSLQMDNSDEGYYDTISALQKSIRGSDINAALYYTAKLIASDQIDILIRRLSVIAYEDIGLANPEIGPRLEAAINAYERLGLPEGRIPLGELVCEMALSPKSNSSHIALDEALKDIEEGKGGNVPGHIKTNSRDYKYPHDYKFAIVRQQYLPDNIKDREYYKPKGIGKEKQYKETYENLRKYFDF